MLGYPTLPKQTLDAKYETKVIKPKDCAEVWMFHIFHTWLVVYKLGFGVIRAAVMLNVSWWIIVLAWLSYTVSGGFPET